MSIQIDSASLTKLYRGCSQAPNIQVRTRRGGGQDEGQRASWLSIGCRC